MELSGDILLKNELWNQVEEKKLLGDGCFFSYLYELFVVACSIGIREDKILENDLNDDSPCRSIARTVYGIKNDNLKNMLYYLFQNAVLNTKLLNYDDDTRMRIAFDPDFYVKDDKQISSATAFLVKFSNYGLEKLFEAYDDNPMLYAENMKELFGEVYSTGDFSNLMNELDNNI